MEAPEGNENCHHVQNDPQRRKIKLEKNPLTNLTNVTILTSTLSIFHSFLALSGPCYGVYHSQLIRCCSHHEDFRYRQLTGFCHKAGYTGSWWHFFKTEVHLHLITPRWHLTENGENLESRARDMTSVPVTVPPLIKK